MYPIIPHEIWKNHHDFKIWWWTSNFKLFNVFQNCMQVVNMDSFAIILQLDQPKAQNFKIGSNKNSIFY